MENATNAKNSTGLRTPQEKRSPSRNALTIGLFAKYLLIHNEDAKEFLISMLRFTRNGRPVGHSKESLVERLERFALLRLAPGSLDIMGDRWTLLVVRDLVLGRTRFKDFSVSPERIPTKILSDRLARLLEVGIIRQIPASDGTKRRAYNLTNK